MTRVLQPPGDAMQRRPGGDLLHLAARTGRLRAARTVLMTLGYGGAVTGIAVGVAALRVPMAHPGWAAPLKAILFCACCAALLRQSGTAIVFRREMDTSTLFPSATLLLVGVFTLTRYTVGWNVAAAVFIAAAIEEVIFRRMLPHRLQTLAERYVGARSAIWIAVVASQLCFAIGHYAVAAASEHAMSLITVVRLAGLGLFLTSLCAIGGLPLAVAAHTVANLAIAAPSRLPTQAPPTGAVLGLCALAAIHLALHDAAARRTERQAWNHPPPR